MLTERRKLIEPQRDFLEHVSLARYKPLCVLIVTSSEIIA